MGHIEQISAILNRLYDPDDATAACNRIEALLSHHGVKQMQESVSRFSQTDVVLITYADSLIETGRAPLRAMGDFCRRFLEKGISAVHFLPFFPYSSDDGFSVIDYFALNPAVGDWEDVVAFSADFDLMFDYVLNHISAKSPWFDSYLAGDPQFETLALAVDPDADLSNVTRPRALPLLTPFTRSDGETVHLWTTFSEDQIDLNYRSIDLLIKMIEVLLFYIEKGARLLRLDAVAYLWKEIGTPCIHLDQTHDMVRLFRKILDAVAPESIIITETNVPHHENISYFGNGFDEAQMVYNFALPPLLLHTFLSEDAHEFCQWADTLETPGDRTTFFNFTASHDGIGVRPVEGLLSGQQVERLIQAVQQNGGQVSYKQNRDGSQSPYELNITYVDALSRGDGMDAERLLAAQSIQLALPGVPGIYIHSLLGSRNWQEGVAQTGRARTINREKLQIERVMDELRNPDSFRSRVFHPYIHLLQTRRAQEAFHPNAAFEILRLDRRVVAIKRQSHHQCIFALVNISCQSVTVDLGMQSGTDRLNELLSGGQLSTERIELAPYQTVWLSSSPPDLFKGG
jgi:sucrose phosphorylase